MCWRMITRLDALRRGWGARSKGSGSLIPASSGGKGWSEKTEVKWVTPFQLSGELHSDKSAWEGFLAGRTLVNQRLHFPFPVIMFCVSLCVCVLMCSCNFLQATCMEQISCTEAFEGLAIFAQLQGSPRISYDVTGEAGGRREQPETYESYWRQLLVCQKGRICLMFRFFIWMQLPLASFLEISDTFVLWSQTTLIILGFTLHFFTPFVWETHFILISSIC